MSITNILFAIKSNQPYLAAMIFWSSILLARIRIALAAGMFILSGGISVSFAMTNGSHAGDQYDHRTHASASIENELASDRHHFFDTGSEPCELQTETLQPCHADGCCLFEVPSIGMPKLFVGFRKSLSAPLAEKPMFGNPVKSPERPPEYL